ncbi:hypothetical protein BJY21_003709 [Kineosphaera limosa]|uniref:Uncharacterized protein n=1 Tax=Kineosphaera limosa NBRC 100340 TaxID=1184609 RepID=K6XEC1_9MICO|nr:hypothetical protein [Kineosphaera limosa]NYE02525.1 hypothetical protein [Kineosphaera limosa]GAB97174.1 hypothetical protein KILIM_058_00260 [Kineosphaera limosa NBRC 100340]
MTDPTSRPTDHTGSATAATEPASRHGAGEGSSRFSPDRELEEMLRDAEETVAQLKAELAARKACARDHGGTWEEQHEEIAKLSEHLANAKVHWGEVRAFFQEALRELADSRQRRGGLG